MSRDLADTMKDRATWSAITGWVVVAAALAAGVRWGLKRLKESEAFEVVFDLDMYFIPASARILAGGSPFDIPEYVHSPLAAMTLAFMQQAGIDPRRGWLALVTLAAFLACIVWTIALTRGQALWVKGLLLAAAYLSVFTSRPFARQLWLGQYDTWLLLTLGIGFLCHTRGWKVAAGLFLGGAALLKLWPAIFLVVLINRNFRTKSHVIGVASAAVLAVVLCLPFGGLGGVLAMLRNAVGMKSQGVMAYSGVGFARGLFQIGGEVAETVVSEPLFLVTAIVVTALALTLMAVTVWRTEDASLCLVVVMALGLIVVPVSHLSYQLLGLPLLWLLCAVFLRRPFDWHAWIPLALSGFWWLKLFLHHPVQADGFPDGTVTASSFSLQMLLVVLHASGGAVYAWSGKSRAGTGREGATSSQRAAAESEPAEPV